MGRFLGNDKVSSDQLPVLKRAKALAQGRYFAQRGLALVTWPALESLPWRERDIIRRQVIDEVVWKCSACLIGRRETSPEPPPDGGGETVGPTLSFTVTDKMSATTRALTVAAIDFVDGAEICKVTGREVEEA